jgi:hypothetical protein
MSPRFVRSPVTVDRPKGAVGLTRNEQVSTAPALKALSALNGFSGCAHTAS